MVEILAQVVVVLYIMRLAVLLVNLISQPYLQNMGESSDEFVSVLIPARNEEMNIGKLLSSLVHQSHHQLEIWVYNDHSTDNTAQIVEKYSANYTRIHLKNGNSLPSGWLGKNHACHNLSQVAKGTYLLFIDADVKLAPHAIENALKTAKRHKTSLLSVFPQQQMHSIGEKLSVPLMNWILLTLLPLVAVRKFKFPSLAAANGQFMLFRTTDYSHWHEKVKNNAVEDIAIMRKMKEEGLKTAVFLGKNDISCRMYTNFEEAANGFSKNILSFFGNSKITAIFFALYTTVCFLPLYLAYNGQAALVLLLFAWGIRLLASYISVQSVAFTVWAAPLQHMAYLYIVLKRVFMARNQKLKWKGRDI